ncbi:sodium:solute symporter family protein [Fictibacillus phosphorivorans]|uniref:sodium:solute symporter family protein n=1 Tax=Fictibacillus phosphorivorans TaxID=1221500 RepID=UPI00203CC912|nr:sodium:solute symporter family protein [Fictibacillus phosphorivorans]MCM3719823.1 sodium:solute symporter family protein [Fictibacillus phosphorivorans]MCM3777506.1 sodium:solute symporter family protein [Fictibacillus phosphorivorans]
MNAALLIIFIVAAIALYLGIRATRGKDMNVNEFAVGNKGFGTLFVFLLIAGEVYTTFTFLGGSGWAYSNGSAAYYVPAYICLAYVLSYWIIPKIWRFAKKHDVISQPQYFLKSYDSKALGLVVAFIGLIALVPYIVIQLKGLGIIVSEASYGAISPLMASTIGAAIVTIYVTISGIHGSAWNAVLKDIMILFVIVFLGTYIPYHYFGGIPQLFEAVQSVKPEALTFASEGYSIPWFVSTIILNAFGFYLLPQSFTVVISAKSERALKKNAITLPLYTILILFAFFIGFAAIIQVPGLQGAEGDLSLLRITMQTFDPWFVGIVGGAGLLTALVPVSVMVMSGAVGLMTGFYKLIKPESSDRQQLVVSKVFVLLIILIAYAFTITGGNALAILNIMSYGLITQLVPALIFSFFSTKLMNKYGAIAGILTGVSIVLFNAITSFKLVNVFPNIPSAINDINIGFVAIGINILIGLTVSFVTKNLILNENSQVAEKIAQ